MGGLTAELVKSIRHRGGKFKYADHHRDGMGLYLQVMPS